MKTLLLLALVAAGLAVGVGVQSLPPDIPDWYYNGPCLQGDETLEQWLPYALPIEDYEPGVFDCSDLSAYAEWLAENCGYDTVIEVGSRHAWVVVEGRTLDAQTGVWDAEQWLPDTEFVFEDLAAAIDHSAADWSWWITKPELRSK